MTLRGDELLLNQIPQTAEPVYKPLRDRVRTVLSSIMGSLTLHADPSSPILPFQPSAAASSISRPVQARRRVYRLCPILNLPTVAQRARFCGNFWRNKKTDHNGKLGVRECSWFAPGQRELHT
jgi:hypothetical protein